MVFDKRPLNLRRWFSITRHIGADFSNANSVESSRVASARRHRGATQATSPAFRQHTLRTTPKTCARSSTLADACPMARASRAAGEVPNSRVPIGDVISKQRQSFQAQKSNNSACRLCFRGRWEKSTNSIRSGFQDGRLLYGATQLRETAAMRPESSSPQPCRRRRDAPV